MSKNFKSSPSLMIPPRLLAGATMLFWGAMTNEIIIALVLAILLEAKNWVKWSWDFDDAAYVKAFQCSLGLLGFVLFLVWMGEVNYHSLNVVIKWFPLCLLPIELAQRFGRSGHMKMNTFFYFARQRMKQDIKEGKEVNPDVFNTGYPYIFILIVVACCTDRMDILTQALLWLLVIWIIISVLHQRGLGVKRLVWALPILIIGVVLMQVEALAFYRTVKGKFSTAADSSVGDTSAQRTNLGNLGEVKQSKEIQWRMWGDDVPSYLLLNTYNKPNLGGWTYDFESEVERFEVLDEAFESGGGIDIIGAEEDGLFIFDIDHQDLVNVPREDRQSIRIRGAGESDVEESVVLSMAGFYAISDMHGEDAKPAVHPLGVLKLVERKSVIDYRLWFNDSNLLERAPSYMDSQLIPGKKERPVKLRESVIKLSKEIGLDEYDLTEHKIDAIRDFFRDKFTYSLAPKEADLDFDGSDLELFMSNQEGGRKGHCEYFATVAALLLREQGIPARYCVGYVVKEKSGDTWNMRGTHAHAWCNVWINGAWEIVDLTPPDWLDIESASNEASWSRGIKDLFLNIKQDFLMWRTDEENKDNMNKLMWGLMIVLLGWIIYRLYKARKVDSVESQNSTGAHGYDVSDDLVLVEGELEELIGKREKSQTYYGWVLEGEDKLDSNLFVVLRELVSFHEESRFGGVDRVQKMAELGVKAKSLLIK